MNKLLAVTVIVLLSGYLNGCDKQEPIQQQEKIAQQQQQVVPQYQPQTNGQPVIINQQPQSDNGLMAGAIGFMAGHILSGGNSTATTHTRVIEKHYIEPPKPIIAPISSKPYFSSTTRGRPTASRPSFSRSKR